MAGFVDFLRMFGLWSSPADTTPDPLPGVTLRLRCTNTLTFRLPAQDSSITLRLPCTNTLTFRLRAN